MKTTNIKKLSIVWRKFDRFERSLIIFSVLFVVTQAVITLIVKILN